MMTKKSFLASMFVLAFAHASACFAADILVEKLCLEQTIAGQRGLCAFYSNKAIEFEELARRTLNLVGELELKSSYLKSVDQMWRKILEESLNYPGPIVIAQAALESFEGEMAVNRAMFDAVYYSNSKMLFLELANQEKMGISKPEPIEIIQRYLWDSRCSIRDIDLYLTAQTLPFLEKVYLGKVALNKKPNSVSTFEKNRAKLDFQRRIKKLEIDTQLVDECVTITPLRPPFDQRVARAKKEVEQLRQVL